ncbi:hypothetical protein EDC04DRAFT_2523792, partial [Pisolithus marmoratus]
QSGVKSMMLSLDSARERLLGKTHTVIECVIEPWTCMHIHGYTITLRGALRLYII